MLTSIRIENFRCFRQLSIEPLKRVNLITGQNNTGKTCLLEALTLALDEGGAHLDQMPRLFRTESPTYWSWLFLNKKTHLPCEFWMRSGSGSAQTVIFRRHHLPDGHWALSGHKSGESSFDIPGAKSLATDIFICRKKTGLFDNSLAVATPYPVHAALDARDFNRVVFKRRNKLAEDFLRKIEPRLLSLQPLVDDHNQPVVFAELSDLPELIPVSQLGQGFGHLLKIASRILAEEAQVVLIDEIENGIHHSVLPVVWKGLADIAARMNVQIFATTHSWECIVAAHEAFAETLDYDFALHRLERIKDDIQAVTYDREALEAAIKGALEVR